ncbi:MAG TPA: U32 family peptidase, partial [Polyangiaceae bacterium]|nr:U32 family peptidase [Polyangiaceae bacterium]
MSVSLPSKGRPEILAPAGTQESFAAALASGADAVYLGLSEGFNARARSTAFGLDTLPELVRRAHRAGTKVYLTVNTLVFESELPEMERFLRGVVAAGVDALIVQDPATAFLARRLAPQLRLHASTQMTISSPEGAAFAATLGMSRVVLPRELNTREIARFTSESDMECEVFVHGALCMAWSGQCLTSEAFSERSANRGQCSQACRMPYDAIVDGKKLELGDVRYLLSPGDLAAHDALPDLLRAGVHSLKIEGRYKGPAYVTTAVDSWRNWRDALVRGVTDADRAQLRRDVERTQLTFSRGGDVGFLGGDDHQKLVVGTTPKHRGIAIGTVREMRGRSVTVALVAQRPLTELRPGLGVKFEPVGRAQSEHDPENVPGGPLFAVRPLQGDLLELGFGVPGPDLGRVRVGDELRLTGDPEISSDTERRLARLPEGRHALNVRVSGREGLPLAVEVELAWSGRTLRASARGTTPLAPVRAGGGLDAALLTDKLGAFGGTPYRLGQLTLDELSPRLHSPVAELKALRRELVASLDAQLDAPAYPAPPTGSCLAELRAELGAGLSALDGPPALVALCRTEEQLEALIASGVSAGDEVELDWMEMVGLTRAVHRAKEAGLSVTLATVRVQKPGEEAYDRRIQNLAPSGVLVRHWGALMHFAPGAQQASQ